MSTGRRGLKPLPLERRGLRPINDYVEAKEEYKNYGAKITPQGEMLIQVHGHWISKKEFDQLIKKPFVPDFKVNLENVDKTGLWMFKP